MTVLLENPSIEREDDFLAAVARSRAIHKNAVTPPRDQEQFRRYLRSMERPNQQAFFIVTNDLLDLAGVVNVSEIVRGAFQSAFLGYYGFAPFLGKSFIRRGVALVVNHCFRSLRLHRLEANIQPWNERSIAIVRSLGFRLEGLSPRYLKVAGQWRDHQRWAILSEEWSPESVSARLTEKAREIKRVSGAAQRQPRG